jgi:Tol biopolymer transport system component
MTLRVQHPGLGGWVEVLLTGEIYPSSPPASPVVVASGRIILIPSFPGAQPVLLSPPGDVYDQPLLSPDGGWVSFQGKESGVYLASLRTNLIWRIGPGRDVVWMPDSSGILFSRSIEDLQGPVGGDLWLATVDGRHLTNLTRSPGVRESQPDIAPDGERVAFVRDGAVFVGVYRSNEKTPFEPPDSPPIDPSMPDPDADPSSNEASMPNTGESLLR